MSKAVRFDDYGGASGRITSAAAETPVAAFIDLDAGQVAGKIVLIP